MSTARITLCLDKPLGLIRPELHGQFAEHLGACVDEGLWVGPESPIPNVGGLRADLLEALKRIHPPVVRWPGGCFADDYHWEDGIGPRADRPRTVNLWWGQSIETNAFGTHEFIQLCRYLGAEPYFGGNLGSGSPAELRDWVEYCNFGRDSTLARRRATNGSPMPFGVRLWGVGNENWGCGGHFCPEDYAAEYKRFSTYLRDLGDTPLFLVGCGPNGNDLEWTRRFFTKLGPYSRIHGYSAHYYCGTAGTATEYSVDQWYELLARSLAMEELVTQQRALMDQFDPQRKVGLIVDEWGSWHPPTPGRHPSHLWQQNTIRDALVAGLTLDIFHRHADKLVMANIAQMVNVLQAMALTEGPRMLLTPTYHVFDMYQAHRGGQSLRCEFEGDAISFAVGSEKRQMPALAGSASVRGDELTLSVVNAHASLPMRARIDLRGATVAREAEVTTLSADDIHAHNTFEQPDAVRPVTSTDAVGQQWEHAFPAASVTVLRARVQSSV